MQPMPPESAEVRKADVTIDTLIRDVNKDIGPAARAVPDTTTEKQNDARRAEILKSGFENASEVYEFGAVRLDLQRLQMQKEAAAGKPVDAEALVAVSQGQAYHEYLPLLLGSLRDSMAKYQAHRKMVPSSVLARPEIARAEVSLQMMLAFLDDALDERVAFANAAMLADAVRRGAKPEGGAMGEDYRKLFDEALKDKALGAASVTVLRQAMSPAPEGKETPEEAVRRVDLAMQAQANALNQRVLDVLSGKTLEAQGVVGFLPQAMSLELLMGAYEQTLSEEKATVLDPNVEKASARLRELEAEAKAAGGKLPKDKKEEYDSLSSRQNDRKAHLAALEKSRATYLDELLDHAGDLGTFQVRAEQLTSTQRQFQRASLDAKRSSTNQPIPDEVMKGIDANMETRKTFHLDRLQAYLDSLEGEEGIMRVTSGKRLEEFNNTTLRPMALKVVQTLAGIASAPVPEQAGMKKRLREAIVGDLERAMGIPKRADGTPKPEAEWTPDERANVEAKARSVMDAVDEFKYRNSKDKEGKTVFETGPDGNRIEKGHTKNLRSTIAAIRRLPPAKNFVNKPMGPLPTERVTPENLDALLKKHGGPAVYAKLLTQLMDDWTVVNDESGEMMRKIDDIVGTHIKVGDAEIQLAADIWGLLEWIAVGLAAMGALYVLDKLNSLRKMVFGDGKATKGDVKALEKKKVDKAEFEEFKKQIQQEIDGKVAADDVGDAEQKPSKARKEIGIEGELGDVEGEARRAGIDTRTGSETDPKADTDPSAKRPKGGRKG